MKREIALTVVVLLGILVASPESARAEFFFAEFPETSDDVYLWPGGLHLGYGYTFDAERGAHAFTLGLDVATIAYDALLIDVVTARVAFRNSCGGERPGCGTGADFFVGSRVAFALYFGDDREHQLSFAAAAGWGDIGHGFGTHVGADDGHFILSPSVRYAVFGVFGIEVALMLPVTGPFGDTYPAAVMINVIGLAGVIIAIAGA